MYRHIQRITIVLLGVSILFACKKKFDDYYERPSSLEPPIYQQLEARGNFKNFLAVVDKSGYKTTLSSAGYWTLFAPHDSAFQVYLTTQNLNSVDQLDSGACRQIVTYCLVYNAFKKERIDDYQASTGWVPDMAFRRRTANYKFVYEGTDASGNPIKVVPSNRNGTTYADADNNNKYIPFFTDAFLQKQNLNASDYNYFYPNTPFSGFNVVDAVVTERDIPAENGVIHVVNKVITALPSIDEYLGGKPEYSLFKSLFDKYLVQYVLNAAVTHRYQVLTGSNENVYTKVYTAQDGTVAFALNNENFLGGGNDGQINAYTIFAPTNDVLQDYITNVLLENYPPNSTLDDVPISIVYDFVNAHLWQTVVWPSKFSSTTNYLGEEARFDPATDVVDKKILSNGIFYGTSKVQEANVFTSVYGRAYLDPKYSMMTKLLNYELRSVVSDIGRNFTLFMISDDILHAAGFTEDYTISNDPFEQFRFTPPPGSTIPASTGATTRNRLIRILNLHVVPNRVVDDLSGEGALMTVGGEYIGYKNNTVFGSGNVDSNTVANIVGTKTSRNGRVFYLDNLLNFSEDLVGAHIEKLGSPDTSPYNYFWQFLKNSPMWKNATKEITGVSNGTFYTLFIPDNNAIMQAVKDGVLPGDPVTGVPNFSAGSQTALEKQAVQNFILFHFVDKRTVAADGDPSGSGSMNTLLKTDIGDPTAVFVVNAVGNMQITDMDNRISHVISPPSTYIGNRIVIHLIDNYLKYQL